MSSRARKKKEEMNGNSLGVVLSPGGLAVAERSEGESSEPQRSAATAKVDADPASGSRPDPEVVAKPKRRTYTAEYKQRNQRSQQELHRAHEDLRYRVVCHSGVLGRLSSKHLIT